MRVYHYVRGEVYAKGCSFLAELNIKTEGAWYYGKPVITSR